MCSVEKRSNCPLLDFDSCCLSLCVFPGPIGTKQCRCAAKPGNLLWPWPSWSVPSNQWSCCLYGRIHLDTQSKGGAKPDAGSMWQPIRLYEQLCATHTI